VYVVYCLFIVCLFVVCSSSQSQNSAALSRNRKKHAMELLEEDNAKLRKELAQVKAKLEQLEKSSSTRAPQQVLFVVLLSVGLLWGSSQLFGGSGGSFVVPNAGGLAEYSHAEIPNLRKLMSVAAEVPCGANDSVLPGVTNETFEWEDGHVCGGGVGVGAHDDCHNKSHDGAS
jgi:hypothetical protein